MYLIEEPFSNPEWTYEVKLDGFRIIATKKGDTVNLFTRARLNYSKYYPGIIEALKDIQYDVVTGW